MAPTTPKYSSTPTLTLYSPILYPTTTTTTSTSTALLYSTLLLTSTTYSLHLYTTQHHTTYHSHPTLFSRFLSDFPTSPSTSALSLLPLPNPSRFRVFQSSLLELTRYVQCSFLPPSLSSTPRFLPKSSRRRCPTTLFFPPGPFLPPTTPIYPSTSNWTLWFSIP